jgi:hypothetical protein
MRGPSHIIEGQVWTFVRLDGRRVDYRIDWVEDQAGAKPASIVKLVNVATGGVGWVTKFWMRRDIRDQRGWFVYDQTKQAVQHDLPARPARARRRAQPVGHPHPR